MTYNKPEIVVLGDASRLIQGKGATNESGVAPGPSADCELDD